MISTPTFVVLGLILFMFVLVPFVIVTTHVNNVIQNTPMISDRSKEAFDRTLGFADDTADWLFAGLLMMIALLDVWLNSRINSIPVFIGLSLFVIILGVTIAIYTNDFYEKGVQGKNVYVDVVDNMPFANWFFTHTVEYFLMIQFFSTYIFWTKRQSGPEGAIS